MARWHRAHNDFVDCKVLEVLTRGKSPRHGKLLIRVGKKEREVPAHEVYDWDPGEFALQPQTAPEPDKESGDKTNANPDE